MSQGRGVFPALTDNTRKTPKVTPLPIAKYLPAKPPAPKKKGR